jgi:hypothetical protein
MGGGIFLPVGRRVTEAEVEVQDFSGAVHAVSRRLHEHLWQAEKYSDECEGLYHQRDGERRRCASDAAEVIKMETVETKMKAKARQRRKKDLRTGGKSPALGFTLRKSGDGDA